MPVAVAKFIKRLGFLTECIHAQVRYFWQSLLAPFLPWIIRYPSVCSLYQPHHHLTVLDIRLTTRRNQSYVVWFQKLFTQHFIECGRDSSSFRKYLDISNPNKFTPDHLACLFQYSDVILTVQFQYAPVIEDLIHLTFIPLEKLCSFRVSHVVYTVIWNVWNLANIV